MTQMILKRVEELRLFSQSINKIYAYRYIVHEEYVGPFCGLAQASTRCLHVAQQ